jgi:CRISPR-associated endonuclease/helicase Cas3
MLSITLEPHYEKVWLGENPSPTTFPPGYPPLHHQWRTRNAQEPLIINTYNTGTGKTKAALLRLLKRAQDIGFSRLDSSEHNALLIAPTNELLAQHARDAKEFCEQNNLPYRVVSISRADLDNYRDLPDFSEGDLRRGAALHYLIQNARRLDGDKHKKATLIVVNPDIFYYAFYFCYGRHDRIPLFQDFLTQFNYIIIDELHYYNPKQFANFLFFMSLSKHYGFIGGATNRQFCLLTATPSEQVQKYLERLQVQIAWIRPEANDTDETGQTEGVPALAPVTLEVYSSQELQEGLLALAHDKREDIALWLNSREDEGGAIISSALWRINQIYSDLKLRISPDTMGRLTGAESRRGRDEAKGKRLILATPTVDIGYNFDRSGKKRQNIDFLLLDARTSDEFIQRLGRAGRVLGKEFADIPSRVLAVVNPELYEALKPHDGHTLNRLALRKLAEDHMPARHVLYAYIQSGTIAEAFRPIYQLEKMTSASDKPDLEVLFNNVKQLFAPEATVGYKTLWGKIHHFEIQDKHYRGLEKIPAEMTDCLKKCEQRLKAEQEYRKSRNKKLWVNAEEAYRWLQEDLRQYFTEKARYSFRESFQPPLALVSDTEGLLSSEPIALYDALHIARNYRAKYFKTRGEWEQKLELSAPDSADDALVFCDLIGMHEPDERIRIGLKLFVGDYRKEWEEQFVFRSTEYEPTALYGLEVIALNSGRGVDDAVKNMFKERFIPALIAADESRTASQLRNLQRQGQCIPYELEVTFPDLKTAKYCAVLGTMALLVWAQILPGYRRVDERKAQASDDDPMII